MHSLITCGYEVGPLLNQMAQCVWSWNCSSSHSQVSNWTEVSGYKVDKKLLLGLINWLDIYRSGAYLQRLSSSAPGRGG